MMPGNPRDNGTPAVQVSLKVIVPSLDVPLVDTIIPQAATSRFDSVAPVMIAE
jgi:hypothetical protein